MNMNIRLSFLRGFFVHLFEMKGGEYEKRTVRKLGPFLMGDIELIWQVDNICLAKSFFLITLYRFHWLRLFFSVSKVGRVNR